MDSLGLTMVWGGYISEQIRNSSKTHENHEITFKKHGNQPEIMKNHKTMEKHENQPDIMKNNEDTSKNYWNYYQKPWKQDNMKNHEKGLGYPRYVTDVGPSAN